MKSEEEVFYEELKNSKSKLVHRALCHINQLNSVIEDLKAQPEPLVWRSTTDIYKSFITDTRYNQLSDNARKWYVPVDAAGDAAKKTLEYFGHEYRGGELWAPPLGPTPEYINDWMLVTPKLIGEKPDLFSGELWVSKPERDEVFKGNYVWRQGTDPDRLHLENGEDVNAFDGYYVKPYRAPRGPGKMFLRNKEADLS